MKFWGPAVVAFLLALGPAQAEINLPPIEDRLKLYEQQLIAKANQDPRPSIELLRQVRDAMAAGAISAAIDSLEILAGKHNGEGEGGFVTWLKLALAYQSKMTNAAKGVPLSDGTAAAYGAYKHASSDPERIDALSALGSLLLQAANLDDEDVADDEDEEADGKPPPDKKNREAARDMAYRVFTELGRLVADDRYKTTLRKLGPEFGLDKVTYPPRPAQDGGCDETTSSPGKSEDESSEDEAEEEDEGGEEDVISASKAECQDNRAHYACLVFTRSLGSNPDEIAAAITVVRERDSSGTPSKDAGASIYPALVQDKSVCYSLDFGASYKFIVDKGLKSAAGESLQRRAVAHLDMPDKAALLGFKRGTYVLPKVGERSITIDTVNVVGAQLMLRRIGDRNLVREILLDHIVGGFADEATEVCFVLNKMGEGIADGLVGLPTSDATKNQSILLTLPIDKILEARRTWLSESPVAKERTLDVSAKGSKLSLKLLGDPAAATSKLGSETGVFALFGTITQPLIDDPDVNDAYDEELCSERRFASQWFIITDTGLSLQMSHTNLYVIARSLATTKAIKDARIELLSRSGLILATGMTDARGIATFPARLAQGTGGNELIAVMAYAGDDFAFLDKTAPAIDLADRGFEGRLSPNAGVDAFIAPIRSIFRPGDLLEALIFMRDLNGAAFAKLPPFEVQLIEANGGAVLVSEAVNIDGKSEQDYAATEADKGVYRFSMRIPEQTRQGMVNLVVSVGGRVAGTSNDLEVRYFQPYTVAITDRPGTWSGAIDEQGVFTLKGEARADYLYGQIVQGQGTDAPAAGLAVEYEVRLVPAESPVPHCYEGFTFGHGAADYRAELFAGTGLATGDDGSISIELVPSRLTQTQVDLPLKAEVTVKVLDANSVAATQKIDVPVTRIGRHWIGAKIGGPQSLSLGRPEANAATQPSVIQFVALDPDGKPVTQSIPTTVSRINNTFVWSYDGSSWDYVPDPAKSRTKVDDPTLSYSAQAGQDTCAAPSFASIPLGETGNYMLELHGKGSTTELAVQNGWTTAQDGSLEPDALVVWVLKKEFSQGEEVEIGVDTPYRAGTVFGELIANGTVHSTFETEIDKDGRANAKVAVQDDWPEGAMHIYVMALRKAEGTASEPGPARAIGGTLIRVGPDHGDPKLTIKATGRKDLPQVEVVVEGLGSDARMALAAVDEGILSVTRHNTPSPVEHYFGGRWLDLQVFDTYGRLLFGKFGGDGLAGLRGMAYRPNDFVAWLSKIQKVENGRVKFAVPVGEGGVPLNFQGEIRLMAWAWDARAFAVAEHHIDVRDPIVVQLAAPQRMAPEDIALLPLRVSAIEVGQHVSIEAHVKEGPLSFPENVTGADAGETCEAEPTLSKCRRYAVTVAKGGPSAVLHVPVKADKVTELYGEKGTIGLSYKVSDTPVARDWTVEVRQPYPPVAVALKRKELAPGKSLTIDKSYFQDLAGSMDESSLQLTVRIAKEDLLPTNDEDTAVLVARPLDQSGLSAQLLLANLSINLPESAPGGDEPSAERLVKLARDMLLLQGADGAFAASAKPGVRYIENEGVARDEVQPDGVGQTAFALDVLSRVNSVVPTTRDAAVNRSVGYLLSELSSVLSAPENGEPTPCTRSHLYAAYVLIKLNRMGSGFFQRLADTCAKDAGNDPVGKVMLASTYKAFGIPKEADKLMAGLDSDALAASGAAPADIARAVALYMENELGGSEPIVIKISDSPTVVDQATESWWARAQAALLKSLKSDAVTVAESDTEITPASVDRQSFPFGVDIQRLRLQQVDEAPVTIANRGDTTLKLSFLGEGIPTNLEKLGEPNYAVTLSFLGRNGPISQKEGMLEVKQFDTIYCIVTINQKKDGYTAPQHLGAVQILPTGFEVVDEYYKWTWEKMVGKAVDGSALSVIDYSETRPDRWIALPRSKHSGNETQLLAFSLRPTIQGEFVLPPLLVRDLDNPLRAGWTVPMKVSVPPAK
jgi:uncharacterized protein YfaS (alpha-2-macroglobulin family)